MDSSSPSQTPTPDDNLEARVFETIAEFAAGAAHELNNPLAVISMLAQNLLVDETNPDRRWALESILEQTRLGHEMLASLRLFARPPQPKEERLDARALFQEWANRERALVADESVQITILDELGADATLTSDSAMLTALLSELGRNAREAVASNAGGRLLFILKAGARDAKGRREVEFCVGDGGRGFDERAKAFAFAPYYSGRRSGRGLGFGLSLARRFAEVLGVRLLYGEEFANEPTEIWRVVVQES